MRKLAILAVVSLIYGCGCASTPALQPIVPQPSPIVVIEPPIPTIPMETPRTDLPNNWFEVKGEGWSYGLPIGFDKIANVDPNIGSSPILAQYHALNTNLTIKFMKHANDAEGSDALQQFIFDKFLPANLDRLVVTIQENDKTTQYTTIAIHTLKPATVGFNAALDFFMQKDKTIYHMSCFADAMNLKQHNKVCFNVMETLHVH